MAGRWQWLVILAVVLGLGADSYSAPQRSKSSRKSAPTKVAKSAVPPPCPYRFRRTPRGNPAAAPRTMQDMFMSMADSFSRNPAMGFQNWVNELSSMEGPALEGVTLTAAEERQAGRQAREEYLRRAQMKGYHVVDDKEKLAYLRELVDGFSKHMTHHERYKNIEITLIDAPVADGQSFPGGYLVFTTALLKEPDEATVAGVVAHELAHLDLGHLYEYARRGKLAETTYSRPPGMGATFDEFFTRQMALFGLLMNPFRPEHEHEADCTSTTWLYLDGYDPTGLVRFFERLHREEQDQPDNPYFNFGRAHPYSLDRREHVARRLKQLQNWKPRPDLGLFPENLKKLKSRFAEKEEARAEGEKAEKAP